MKKWLLAAGLGLALATSAQAADKIAIVNMGSLFQQVAQKTGVSNTLENEFKGRASELQRMETDLQAKMKKLQSMKAGSAISTRGKRHSVTTIVILRGASPISAANICEVSSVTVPLRNPQIPATTQAVISSKQVMINRRET